MVDLLPKREQKPNPSEFQSSDEIISKSKLNRIWSNFGFATQNKWKHANLSLKTYKNKAVWSKLESSSAKMDCHFRHPNSGDKKSEWSAENTRSGQRKAYRTGSRRGPTNSGSNDGIDTFLQCKSNHNIQNSEHSKRKSKTLITTWIAAEIWTQL